MKILIESASGPDIEIHIHPNGTGTVRVDTSPAGSCRWEKDGNRLRLSLSDDVLKRNDSNVGMSFEFEER
jgi:hypothetical protein